MQILTTALFVYLQELLDLLAQEQALEQDREELKRSVDHNAEQRRLEVILSKERESGHLRIIRMTEAHEEERLQLNAQLNPPEDTNCDVFANRPSPSLAWT